ncbi:MAG: tRNA threonylcarbamoyladenosine dehydratase [Clostridia bacterium]|nr:tRNA threonylcarbamoyladenosine dehydratase [Clostridia bacterium]
MDQFSRTRLLLGDEGVERLASARVAVFGIGGVGSYAAEALARAGVGAIDLVDSDRVSLTNLNRQLPALHSTLGRLKTEVMAERLRDIHPGLKVTEWPLFYTPDNEGGLVFTDFDCVADCVDTVTAKLGIICRCREAGVPVISAMGAGNKLDPTAFRAGDISETTVCPLARIMRRELKRRGIEHLPVVYSTEPPLSPLEEAAEAPPEGRRALPGSVSFVPSVMGLILAGEIVKALALPERKTDA